LKFPPSFSSPLRFIFMICSPDVAHERTFEVFLDVPPTSVTICRDPPSLGSAIFSSMGGSFLQPSLLFVDISIIFSFGSCLGVRTKERSDAPLLSVSQTETLSYLLQLCRPADRGVNPDVGWRLLLPRSLSDSLASPSLD